jgi:hypothetical protein
LIDFVALDGRQTARLWDVWPAGGLAARIGSTKLDFTRFATSDNVCYVRFGDRKMPGKRGVSDQGRL